MRSALGIVVGLVFIVVGVFVGEFVGLFVTGSMPDMTTGQFPEDANPVALCAWNVAWMLPTALAAAVITGFIARRRSLAHGFVLAGFVIVGGIVFTMIGRRVYTDAGLELPGWYSFAFPASGVLGAIIGGWLHQTVNRRAAGGEA